VFSFNFCIELASFLLDFGYKKTPAAFETTGARKQIEICDVGVV